MVLLSRFALFSFILSIIGISVSKVDAHVKGQPINENFNSQDEWSDWEVRSDFKCPTLFGSYPDTEDCTRFYRCIGGRPVHLRCGKAKQFDKYRRKCLAFIIAICDRGDRGKTTTPSDGLTTTIKDEKFLCPTLLGNYPHSVDCSMYHVCRLFIPTLKHCPENQLFDAIKRECKPEDEVHCGSRIRPTKETTTISVIIPSTSTKQPTTTEISTTTMETSTASQPSTTTETPTVIMLSTTTELPTVTESSTTTGQPTVTEPSTTTGQPTVTEPSTTTEQSTVTEPSTTTGQPTVTEPSTTTEQPTSTNEPTSPKPPKPTGPPETDCDEDDLDCIITETGEIPDWFECPVELGAYRHPSNKKLFIYCQNWKPFVKKCGQDLIFSQEARTCVSPDKVIPHV